RPGLHRRRGRERAGRPRRRRRRPGLPGRGARPGAQPDCPARRQRLRPGRAGPHAGDRRPRGPGDRPPGAGGPGPWGRLGRRQVVRERDLLRRAAGVVGLVPRRPGQAVAADMLPLPADRQHGARLAAAVEELAAQLRPDPHRLPAPQLGPLLAVDDQRELALQHDVDLLLALVAMDAPPLAGSQQDQVEPEAGDAQLRARRTTSPRRTSPSPRRTGTTRRTSSARTSTPASVRRQAERTIKRLDKSLDEAQTALRALGKDLGKSGKEAYKDVEGLMRNLRRDAGKANRRAIQDLDKLQKALRQSPTTRRSTSRSTGRKTTSG